MSWRPEFFRWLQHQLIVVEYWPYAGTDFTGDPNLPLPEGDDWDKELGKILLFIFYVFMIFLVIHVRSNNDFMCMQTLAQRGPRACRPLRVEPMSKMTLRLDRKSVV